MSNLAGSAVEDAPVGERLAEIVRPTAGTAGDEVDVNAGVLPASAAA